jgi:hypothetical protein
MDCFASLAMTATIVIVREGGRSSIPEAAVIARRLTSAAAYWVPRFRGGRQWWLVRQQRQKNKKPALPPAFVD